MTRQKFREEANKFSLYFFIIGIVVLFSNSLFVFCFRKVGEGLTYRLRVDSFKKMISMPCEWFDIP